MNLFYQLTATVPSTPSSIALALGASSASTAPISPTAPAGRLMCTFYATTDCYIRNGATVTTNGTDMVLPGGMWTRLAISAGTVISAAAVSGSGTLYITPDA